MRLLASSGTVTTILGGPPSAPGVAGTVVTLGVGTTTVIPAPGGPQTIAGRVFDTGSRFVAAELLAAGWVAVIDPATGAPCEAGPTSARPAAFDGQRASLPVGTPFADVSLSVIVVWSGSQWLNAVTGAPA